MKCIRKLRYALYPVKYDIAENLSDLVVSLYGIKGLE